MPKNNLTLLKLKLILLLVAFNIFGLVLYTGNISHAAKLSDGIWAQSANPGTTTITFTNGATLLESGFDIVLTFPGTAAINAAGTNVSVTGQTNPTRVNNVIDNTISITLDGTIETTEAITITMTDGLTSYTTSTYAQESLAINTQNAADGPIDFGVAIKTNDNTTTVTTQVPLFVTLAVNTTSIQLGTLSTSSINQANQTYTVNSNNRSGVTLQIIADGDLNDGFGNTINAVADGAITAGSEEYGIGIDNVTGVTIAAPFNAGDDALPQVATDIATTATEVSNGVFDVNYKASITGTTIAGSYDQIVTVTIAANA